MHTVDYKRVLMLLAGLAMTNIVQAGSSAQASVAGEPILPSAIESQWTLQLPEEDKVVFKGVLDYDASGQSGSMMYPAPNAGGFIAGLITHAIILESVKNKQKTAAQETADKVLTPYQDVIQTYTYRELMRRALDKLSDIRPVQFIAFTEKAPSEWLIQSTPVFSLTQDQSAWVLDNVISIAQPGVPAYQNTIRVVSTGNHETHMAQYWTANQGEKLKAESAGLVAESLRIALKGAAGKLETESGAHKTVRYYEGKNEKMERALVLSEQCDRALIKTLRGWLMSVPIARKEASSTCVGPSASNHTSATLR